MNGPSKAAERLLSVGWLKSVGPLRRLKKKTTGFAMVLPWAFDPVLLDFSDVLGKKTTGLALGVFKAGFYRGSEAKKVLPLGF